MLPLRRLLKPGVLTSWLEEAHAASQGRLSLAVLDGQETLAACGPERDLARRPAGELLAFGLGAGEAAGQGRLLLLPGPEADHALCQGLGRLLARSLREAVERGLALRAANAETLEQYREAALLRRAATTLNQSLRLPEVTQALLAECSSGAAGAELGMVFSLDDAQGQYEPLGSFGPAEETSLHLIAESALFKEVMGGARGEIINDLAADPRWQNEVPGLAALLCLPLKSPGHWAGGLVLGSRRRAEFFRAADLTRMTTIASVAATAMANAHHFEEVQRMLQALLRALATAIDSRDPCTSGHSQRVALYAAALASAAVETSLLPPAPASAATGPSEIYFAGLLHDVGKIGVREEVLTKSTRLGQGRVEAMKLRMAVWGDLTGRDWRADLARLERVNGANLLSDEDADFICSLAEQQVIVCEEEHQLLPPEERERLLIPRGNLTQEEWDEIRRHPAESHRILRQIPFPPQYRQVPTIVRQHHEKLDGSGYPDGSLAREILPSSRILAIADIYDALTAKDRPYKKSLPREKALSILREEADMGKLDPDLVELFCARIDEIEARVRP
jgi:HD-GYP domain-containing protein (c-di-GMP phosphodiesterase class II)